MLDLSYEEGNTNRWRPRRGLTFRTFELSGTSEDLDEFISAVNGVAADGHPVVTPITEDGRAAWLVVARSDTDLELVHLERGLALTGDVESLRDVATSAGHCLAQGRGDSPLHGYHTYVEAHDVHNLSRGRLLHERIADLRITWVSVTP